MSVVTTFDTGPKGWKSDLFFVGFFEFCNVADETEGAGRVFCAVLDTMLVLCGGKSADLAVRATSEASWFGSAGNVTFFANFCKIEVDVFLSRDCATSPSNPAGLVTCEFGRRGLAVAFSLRTRLVALVTGPVIFDVADPETVGFKVSETWLAGCIPAVVASIGRAVFGAAGKVSDDAEIAVADAGWAAGGSGKSAW